MSLQTSGREEYLNWDKYISNCENISGLTNAEKEAAKDALIYLRSKLGERFLLRIYNPHSKRPPHPLGLTILNQVASTRLDLIRYAEGLRAVENAKNFKGLLKRFKDSDEFPEGSSVLDVSLEFHRTGFDIEFEPKVFVTDQNNKVRRRFPDLRVINRNTKETAVVEVTELKRSARWDQAVVDCNPVVSLNFSDLSSARLTMWADMNANFNSSRVEETLELIKQTIKEVKQTGEFRAFITDCVEVGITHSDNEEPLKHWAEERGISPGISGPPVESDELIRAFEKIKGKLSQLPQTEPGIIVIPTTHSGLFWRYDAKSIIDFLTDKISAFPKVFCIVLTDGFIDGGTDESHAVATPDYAYVNRHIKGVSERTIVIFNKSYAGPMSYSLFQQIRRTFLYI